METHSNRNQQWKPILVFMIALLLSLFVHSQNGYGYTLTITSTPSGATVFWDNQEKGRTPLKIKDVKEKVYKITIVKEGYDTYETVIWIGPDGYKIYKEGIWTGLA